MAFLADGSTCGCPSTNNSSAGKATFATSEKIQAKQRRKTAKVDILVKVNLG
jgi:hypothetical protein